MDSIIQKINNNNLTEAKVEINQILNESPSNHLALYYLSLINFKLKNYSISLNNINQALELDTHKVDYHSLKASILLKTKSFNEALNSINIAINNSTYPDLIENKIVILRKLEKFEEALFHLKTLDQNDSRQLLEGIINFEMKNYTRSKEIFENQLDGDNKEVSNLYLKRLNKMN